MNNITGYESPIDIIIGQMETNLENDIIQTIQKIGIDINKEELIKAINYDRQQYSKGFENGYNKALSELTTALLYKFTEYDKKGYTEHTNAGIKTKIIEISDNLYKKS